MSCIMLVFQKILCFCGATRLKYSENFEAIAVFCIVLNLWLSSCIDHVCLPSYVGLVQVLWQRHDFKALLNSVILAKCFKAKLWESSRHMSRQLAGIGVIYLFYGPITTLYCTV